MWSKMNTQRSLIRVRIINEIKLELNAVETTKKYLLNKK